MIVFFLFSFFQVCFHPLPCLHVLKMKDNKNLSYIISKVQETIFGTYVLGQEARKGGSETYLPSSLPLPNLFPLFLLSLPLSPSFSHLTSHVMESHTLGYTHPVVPLAGFSQILFNFYMDTYFLSLSLLVPSAYPSIHA